MLDGNPVLPGERRLPGVRKTFDCDVDGLADGTCTFTYCVPERPRNDYLRCLHTYGLPVNHRRRLFHYVLRCVPPAASPSGVPGAVTL